MIMSIVCYFYYSINPITLNSFFFLADVLHSSVLPVWTTLSLWKKVRTVLPHVRSQTQDFHYLV